MIFGSANQTRIAVSFTALTLAACSSYPEPPDTDEPKTSSLVACIKQDNRGYVKDGYIITSAGDSVSVYRLFLHLLRSRIPSTVVVPPAVEEAMMDWHPVGYTDKNGTQLPLPESCAPKK